jgi:DNA-directed RNA polymerase subunit RPC12/RpoP
MTHKLAVSARWSAYWCLGCGELIRIPKWDILTTGLAPVRSKDHPENQLLWREQREMDHAHCSARRLVEPREARPPWSIIQ